MNAAKLGAGLMTGALAWGAVAYAQQTPKPAAPGKPSPFAAPQPASAPASAKAPAGDSKTQAAEPALNEKEQPAARPAGRGTKRDPFNSLIVEKKKPDAGPIRYPPGKKGLVIGQLELKGIARAVDGSWIAVVDNKTQRAFFLREKDQLYNGIVSKISPDRVVFLESGNGGSGQAPPREVVKRLAAE